IMFDCECENYTEALEILLSDTEPKVHKKAIEVAGKVKNFKLLPKVIEVAAEQKAYPSFKHSILYYGDEMFSEDNWQDQELPLELIEIAIKTSGNIKGENSTNFLTRLLKEKT